MCLSTDSTERSFAIQTTPDILLLYLYLFFFELIIVVNLSAFLSSWNEYFRMQTTSGRTS